MDTRLAMNRGSSDLCNGWIVLTGFEIIGESNFARFDVSNADILKMSGVDGRESVDQKEQSASDYSFK